MSDLDTCAAELINEHRKLEAAKTKFEKMKLTYLTMLMRQNVGAVDVKEGKVTVCTRTSKDYGDTIKNLEATLKAEKTRLDYLCEYTIKSVTHYLRIG